MDKVCERSNAHIFNSEGKPSGNYKANIQSG